eukprot:gb/GFBE01037622.1/.p1 GENE.gb/GFBE01037622.1/~~gb/GFBE01037622.1/.p1  ORF type:complete len:492 (+),score=123.63 gb/GFBE01037622.1/:1-1476(+)
MLKAIPFCLWATLAVLVSGECAAPGRTCDDVVSLLQQNVDFRPQKKEKAASPLVPDVAPTVEKAAVDGVEDAAAVAKPNSVLQEAGHAATKQTGKGLASETVTMLVGFAIFLVVLTLSKNIAGMLRRVMAVRSQSETAPAEANGGGSQRSSVFSSLSVVFLGIMYIAFSTAIIKYNKFLMDGRFPFAVNLTFGHQASGFVCLFLLYAVKPSLFKSLAGSATERRNDLDAKYVVRNMFPIGLFTSGTLVLSNLAYEFSSVAFLQMMKEANIVLVYLLSVIVGMELFNSLRARILLCLFLSTSLCVQGELSFDLHGFLIQGSSQLFESSKIVLQSVLLCAAAGKKWDPMSFNLMIQPVCASMIAIFLYLAMTCDFGIATATWADYAIWWPHLALNAVVALGLNLSICTFIANTSGVGFVVLGICKDVVIVCIDVLLSGTRISHLQIAAFSCQLFFVSCYSLFKLFPEPTETNDNQEKSKISDGKEGQKAESTS